MALPTTGEIIDLTNDAHPVIDLTAVPDSVDMAPPALERSYTMHVTPSDHDADITISSSLPVDERMNLFIRQLEHDQAFEDHFQQITKVLLDYFAYNAYSILDGSEEDSPVLDPDIYYPTLVEEFDQQLSYFRRFQNALTQVMDTKRTQHHRFIFYPNAEEQDAFYESTVKEIFKLAAYYPNFKLEDFNWFAEEKYNLSEVPSHYIE